MMRNKHIAPRFAAVAASVVGGVGTPFHRGRLFGQHDGIFHLVTGFGLQHQNAIFGFGHEIRLIFQVIGAVAGA